MALPTPEDFFQRVGSDRKPPRPRNVTAGEPAVATKGQDPNQEKPVATDGEQRWASSHDVFWGTTQTHDQLPPGVYSCGLSQVGPILQRMTVQTDDLLMLPDEASSDLVNEFRRFWTLGDAFRARGFLHKRGFLVWGPPGSGKTSTFALLMRSLIDTLGGVILFLESPTVAAECLALARRIEPERPMIAVMEDIDALIEKYGESEYLALLDGEAQVDNIVFLASTNYPERLDPRFVDRPSRFDTIRYVGMPSAAARECYFLAKEPDISKEELARWVEVTEGLSIAHLKELIIAVRCLGQPLEGAGGVAERLQAMHERRPSSDDSPDRRQMGFGRVVSLAGR
jgi:hypothetical protein